MRALRPLVLSLLAAALLLSDRPAAAYSRAEVPSAPGVYLSWSKRLLGYAVSQRGCPGLTVVQLEAALTQAFASWADPPCSDIAFEYLGAVAATQTNLTLGAGQPPDGQSLLVWHQDSWPPAGVSDASVTAEMPAVTTVLYDASSGEIIDADVDLNAVHFSWGVLDGQREAFADVQSVLAHEVGHLLGLGHSRDAQATMYPTLAAGETKKRSLEADDIAGLCFVYPAGLPTPAGPGDSDPPRLEEGGCAVAAGPRPGPSPAQSRGDLWIWGLLGAACLWRLAKAARRRYTAAP